MMFTAERRGRHGVGKLEDKLGARKCGLAYGAELVAPVRADSLNSTQNSATALLFHRFSSKQKPSHSFLQLL